MGEGRDVQVARLTEILNHIVVPASGGFPEIEIRGYGPTDRVAAHLVDVCGVRVETPAEPVESVEGVD